MSPATAGPAVVFVSGGAGGIGAACAVEFAQRGWRVAASFYGDEDPAAAQKLLQSSDGIGDIAGPEPIRPVRLDVTDAQSCKEAVADVLAAWGRIDALVNCAGTTRFVPHNQLDDIDAADFRQLYDVNLIGTFQLTRACAPALAVSGRGAVVNISSIAGLRGTGSSVAYAASKGALNTLTLSLARSLAPHVRVNAIAPGFVDGGLPQRVLPAERYGKLLQQQSDNAPLKRVSLPQEIGELAWFLCERAPGMTGQIAVIDNGLQLG